MAAELKKLAEYFAGKGAQYADLVGVTRVAAREAERLGEHELPRDKKITNANGDVSSQRPEERLVLPSKDQLVITVQAELRRAFGKEFEIPQPPDALFEDLENFNRLGIRRFEVSYQPQIQFDPEAELDPKNPATLPIWKKGAGVKPEPYFWQLIKEGKLPSESAVLPEGWILGDGRAKPRYQNGKQRYEDDGFMQAIMDDLRNNRGIARYQYVPNDSRFGVFPDEIEQVVIPHFTSVTGAKGLVEYPTALEFNTRGNAAHPEWGRTDTAEWFSDKAFGGRNRLRGGHSGFGGLAGVVGDWRSDDRDDFIGFRLQVRYPSQKPA